MCMYVFFVGKGKKAPKKATTQRRRVGRRSPQLEITNEATNGPWKCVEQAWVRLGDYSGVCCVAIEGCPVVGVSNREDSKTRARKTKMIC